MYELGKIPFLPSCMLLPLLYQPPAFICAVSIQSELSSSTISTSYTLLPDSPPPPLICIPVISLPPHISLSLSLMNKSKVFRLYIYFDACNCCTHRCICPSGQFCFIGGFLRQLSSVQAITIYFVLISLYFSRQ